jgi:hypothetical protein
MKAWGQKLNFSSCYRQLRSVGSARKTNDSDEVSSSDMRVKFFEISGTFVVGGVTQNLKTLTLLPEVIKD